MSRLTVVLGLLAVAAVAVPSTASARTVNFTGTATARVIAGNVIAGTTTGTFGPGAVVYRTRVGPNNTVVSSFTLMQATGTFRGTATVTQTPGQNGAPTTLTGTARITGGTGRYRGARGRFSLSGQIAADGLISLRGTNGRVTYRD
jgi:hypothetical protein